LIDYYDVKNEKMAAGHLANVRDKAEEDQILTTLRNWLEVAELIRLKGKAKEIREARLKDRERYFAGLLNYKKCRNPVDYVDYDPFSDENPPIELDFADHVHCYREQHLRKTLEQEAPLRNWIRHPESKISDEDYESTGEGGGPGQDEYYLLDPAFYIDKRSRDTILNSLSEDKTSFRLHEKGKVRLGNRTGTFGVSNLHGQSKEMIYGTGD
jgi:hypothetical protein